VHFQSAVLRARVTVGVITVGEIKRLLRKRTAELTKIPSDEHSRQCHARAAGRSAARLGKLGSDEDVYGESAINRYPSKRS